MATYTEIRPMYNDAGLRNTVAVAIAVCGHTVISGNDNVAPFSQIAGAHDLRVAYAKSILGNTAGEAQKFLEMLLAKNVGLSVAQILGANDATIQAQVNSMYDLFAGVAV